VTTNGDVIATRYALPARYPESTFSYTLVPHDRGSILTLVVSPVQYVSTVLTLRPSWDAISLLGPPYYLTFAQTNGNMQRREERLKGRD
jgi:hypothetical protein